MSIFLASSFLLLSVSYLTPVAHKVLENPSSVQKQFTNLEASSGGRLGIYAINTEDGTSIQYRAKERFPFCSTAKTVVVAAILKQSMSNKDLLKERITYKKEDINSYAPVTKKHLHDGMTISELCAAAITQSDNTAMNLLIKKLGGLHAINNFARYIGDNTFRLDRFEPNLNSAIPNDDRDTSTPMAMALDLQKIVFSNVLGASQRAQFIIWLKNNITGYAKIRAGAPKNWVVGDKTGGGDYGTTNDIAVIWPPGCKPIVVAIYFTQNTKTAAPRDDVIAKAIKLLISVIYNILD